MTDAIAGLSAFLSAAVRGILAPGSVSMRVCAFRVAATLL